jgi:hypothetical protein
MEFKFNFKAEKGVAKAEGNMTVTVGVDDVNALYNSDGEYPSIVRDIIAIVKDEQRFSHEREEARDDSDDQIEELRNELKETRDKAQKDHRQLFNEVVHLKEFLINNNIDFETGRPYGAEAPKIDEEDEDPEIPDPTKDEKETEW